MEAAIFDIPVEHLGPWPAVFAAIWGLLWGSFANVVAHRVPRGESVLRPPSHCPECDSQVRWFDNIPVLSYLVLRGRCRDCGTSISIRYPIVEAVCGALCLALWLHIVSGRDEVIWTQAALVFVLQSYLFVGLIALTAIDWEHQLLPHKLTIPLIVLGMFAAWVFPADGLWLRYHPAPSLVDSVIGAVAGMLVIWAVFQIFLAVSGKVGIGGGDMFLLGVVGAWFGWQSLPLVLLLAALQGILWVTVSLFWPVSDRREQAEERDASGSRTSSEDSAEGEPDELGANGVAFGPFLAVASVEYVFAGSTLLHWLTGGALGG